MLTGVLSSSPWDVSGYVSSAASSDEKLPCEQIIGVN